MGVTVAMATKWSRALWTITSGALTANVIVCLGWVTVWEDTDSEDV